MKRCGELKLLKVQKFQKKSLYIVEGRIRMHQFRSGHHDSTQRERIECFES